MTLFSSVPTLSNPISVGGGRATYVNPWTFRVRRKLNFDDSESIELPKELEITRKPEITRKSEISKNSGISKNRKITIPRSVPLQEIKRQKSKFIDNSAVEEDADGVSLQSRETTPDKELPGKIKPVQCQDCGKFVSGPKVLPNHQKSKKCKNRSKGWKTFSCHKCGKVFNNRHDSTRHRSTCKK